MKRRTEITIESERVLVVANGRQDYVERWCEECKADARLVAVDDAAALLRVTQEEVLSSAAAAGLHITAETNGSSFLCLNSLVRAARRSESIEMKTTDSDVFHA